jgi:hypothetical protein
MPEQGSIVVATLFLVGQAESDFLRVERATSGINAGPFVSEVTDPSVLAPVAQRVKINIYAHCHVSGALMGLLDFLGKLQPGVIIRSQVVRVSEGSADALVIFPPEPSDTNGLLVGDGDS